jgi:hypothetical protein
VEQEHVMQSDQPNRPAPSLEIILRCSSPGAYAIDLRFDDPVSAAPAELASGAPFALDAEALRVAALDPVVYGAQLSAMLFADRAVREGWATAWGYALRGESPLRVRLHIAADAPELHALRWELLQHPQSGQFLATDERIVLSRYLASGAMAPLRRRAAGELRALVLIASPTDLADFRLAPVDVAGETSRARVALSALSPIIVARGQGGPPISAGLIAEQVRDGYDVIALVAHGGTRDGEPFLMLEGPDGRAAPTPAATLVDMLSQMARRPTLVVLASCQSAGDESEAAITALGPQLLRAGVPAVLAMQGPISMIALATMMPIFFRELLRDGQIDRALAAARSGAGHLSDWWRPVLYSRLRDGRLWVDTSVAPVKAEVSPPTGVNPFGRIGRIDDVAAVFGRDDLLRRLFEELSKGVSVSLVGERQIGKSSLLSLVRQLGPAHLHLPPESFIYLNMQIVDDENDFFEALCAEMNLPPLRGSKLARALRGKQFVVCLDEVEKMSNTAGFSGAEREQLRGLADGGAPLRLVIASSVPLERLFPDSEGKTSPLANICQKLDVAPFTPKLAREFLSARLEGTGVCFSDEEIDRLLRQSNGHPARLQRAAGEVFERYRGA